MASQGGSVRECSINGRIYSIAADADVTYDLGGYSNALEPNGNLTARQIKTAKVWKVEGLNVQIDHVIGDLQFLQAIANGSAMVPISVTFVDKTTFQGAGTVVDDLQGSTQSATATLSLNGEGELTQQ